MAKQKQELKDFVEENAGVYPELRDYFKFLNDNVVTWPTTTTTTSTTTTTT